MIKVRDTLVRSANGQIDADSWQAQLCSTYDELDPDLIHKALSFVRQLPARSEEFLEKGLELASLVASLNMDTVCVAAALIYRPVRTKSVEVSRIETAIDHEVSALVSAVARMADTSLLEMTNAVMQTSEARDQVENVRRMLVSMIDDARVAILKLAERLLALRTAKNSSEERQQRIAQEAHLVFVPLANRLGIWRLKWELEDLSLRYLAPDIYKTIAGQLDGRRDERESQVLDIVNSVQERLRRNAIEATVTGRAKHIFSIWRKMQVKNVGLTEVYDVRAIRVLVPDIAQCYAALGVIHTQWQFIPSEFDDYIAVPKENGYRSIHTAVMGEDRKTLEVQIRTPEMHEEAELGVCAHWSYKGREAEDRPYTEKMDWLRQVVEWQEESRQRIRSDPWRQELRNRVHEERIFVYTPKGHVLDLTTGATPIDFAYRVHTEVGNHCREARVDGTMVALNTPLQTGQRVEVLTDDMAQPQRVWLDNHLECVKTSRARAKIEEWFHARDSQTNLAGGQELLAATIDRLGIVKPDQAELAQLALRLGFDGVGALLVALGAGDCQILDVLDGLYSAGAVPAQMSLLPGSALPSGIYNINVRAQDRDGLLLDISTFLSKRGVQLLSNTGVVDPATQQASIAFSARLSGIHELVQVIDGLRQIPRVIDVRRIENRRRLD